MSEGIAEAGDAVSAGLLAREIERARVDKPAVGHGVHEPCANCGTIRQGPYCHACGQAGHVHRSAGALVHDIAHGVFHFEGKLWATLPLLVRRPGELTRRYVHGERAKFVSPMALFLFSVFLLFTVVANLPGVGEDKPPAGTISFGERRTQVERELAGLKAERARATDDSTRDRLDDRIEGATDQLSALGVAGAAAGDARASDRDADIVAGKVRTGWRWLDAAVAHSARNPELTLYKLKSYGYKYSWALIPISLPFLWLLFAFRRDVGLYDHAIFAIYSLSFMSLGVVALAVAGAIGAPDALIVLAVVLGPPLHMYRQLKGAYALGRFGALWRTAALLAITVVCAILFLAFLLWMGSE